MPPLYSIIVYGRADHRIGRNDMELEPLEFNFPFMGHDEPTHIKRAKFEGTWYHGTHVKLRAPDGTILYDGEV